MSAARGVEREQWRGSRVFYAREAAATRSRFFAPACAKHASSPLGRIMPKKLPKTESVRVCKGREPGVNPSSIGEQTRSERITTKSGLLARNPGPLIGRSVPRGRVFVCARAVDVKTEARANARRRRARKGPSPGRGIEPRRRLAHEPTVSDRSAKASAGGDAASANVHERAGATLSPSADETHLRSPSFVPAGRRGTTRCLGAHSCTSTTPRMTTRSTRGAGNGGRPRSSRTGGSSPR